MQTFSSASPVPIYFRCDVINTANANTADGQYIFIGRYMYNERRAIPYVCHIVICLHNFFVHALAYYHFTDISPIWYVHYSTLFLIVSLLVF